MQIPMSDSLESDAYIMHTCAWIYACNFIREQLYTYIYSTEVKVGNYVRVVLYINERILQWQVKENVNGKKASIVEVKRAINQTIPHF